MQLLRRSLHPQNRQEYDCDMREKEWNFSFVRGCPANVGEMSNKRCVQRRLYSKNRSIDLDKDNIINIHMTDELEKKLKKKNCVKHFSYLLRDTGSLFFHLFVMVP